MGMVISGSGIDSAECRELRAKWRERVQQYDDMDATLKFESEDAFIEFQHNGRTMTPHLVLMGRPVSVEADFPWDVSGVEYANKLDRQLIAYRYEFTRENLADLASKGLFEKGFETPEVLRKNTFELPCTVSCVAIGPESDVDFPVVFVSLNPGSLVCDDNMSGYTIHDYFENMPEEEPEDLVYESAVARTLPYENMFTRVGEQLKEAVPDAPEPEDEGYDPYEDEDEGIIPGYEPDGLGGPVPPPDFEHEPGGEVPEYGIPEELSGGPRIDRRQAIEEMGGPDADDPEEGFFTVGEDQYD